MADPARADVMLMTPDEFLVYPLEAGDVIPGFACPVSAVFEGIARDLG